MCRLMDQQALQEQFKDLEYLAADFLEREEFESAANCYQHLNLDDPEDGGDIDLIPHKSKERKVNAALSNSFGFGGTNASLVF